MQAGAAASFAEMRLKPPVWLTELELGGDGRIAGVGGGERGGEREGVLPG